MPSVTYRSLASFPFRVVVCRLVCHAAFGCLPVVIGTNGTHDTHPEVIWTEKIKKLIFLGIYADTKVP